MQAHIVDEPKDDGQQKPYNVVRAKVNGKIVVEFRFRSVGEDSMDQISALIGLGIYPPGVSIDVETVN